MSHLHVQLHSFSLLSNQSYSAHTHVLLSHRDARLVHLAKVLGLKQTEARTFVWNVDYHRTFVRKHFFQFKRGWHFLKGARECPKKYWSKPFLWRCWAWFRWSQPVAVDSQGETTWLWSSREPDKEKCHEKRLLNINMFNTTELNQMQLKTVFKRSCEKDMYPFVCSLIGESTNLLEDVMCCGSRGAVKVDTDPLAPFQ